jgi:glycosyltransferase involved in cell wall biosynthesis
MFHIIIPTYNRENLISRSINSILNQNNKNWKLYVIDDGSIDNTKNIVDNYIKKYPDKIYYFYQKNK